MPEQLREQAELYAGCISGAIQKEVYLKIITDTGFTDVQVQKEKKIQLPDELLNQFLNEEQVMLFKKGDFGLREAKASTTHLQYLRAKTARNDHFETRRYIAAEILRDKK